MVHVPDRKFPVIEIFGPTLQGEGALIGSQTHFIRFGGCDYRCSWCDTKEAVEPELILQRVQNLTIQEIVNLVADLHGNPQWVTLSGGNPLLYQLGELVLKLQAFGYKVAVETQGSIYKEWVKEVDLLTISPKAPSSGMSSRTNIETIKKLATTARDSCLKIPVADRVDLMWAKSIFDELKWLRAYVQPVRQMGDSTGQQLQALEFLAKMVLEGNGLGRVVVLPQLHAVIGLK